MAREKSPSIRDIAQNLNVSVTTVMKALRGLPKISEETRKKVLAEAKRIGYQPDLRAQALAGRRKRFLLLSSLSNDTYMRSSGRGIKQAKEELSAFGVQIEHWGVPTIYDSKAFAALLERAYQTKPDGILLNPLLFPADYVDQLKKFEAAGIPIAIVHERIDEVEGDSFSGADWACIGSLAAQLLNWILPDSSRIAVITTSLRYGPHREVLRGFSNTISGKTCAEMRIYENEDSPSVTTRITRQILQEFPDVDAIYVTSYHTIPVCDYLEKVGMSGKIVVIGQDLFPKQYEYIESGKVTAALYAEPAQIYRHAVHAVFDASCAKKPPKDILVPPVIVCKANLKSYPFEKETIGGNYMNELKDLFSRYLDLVHSPKNQHNKQYWENADEPYLIERWRGRSLRKTNTPFTMALDISGYSKVLGIDCARYYSDPVVRLKEQLRYALWEGEHLDCHRYFEPSVFSGQGMFELAWFGCQFQLLPGQAPWYDERHPVFEDPKALLRIKPFDFYRSGINPQVIEAYETMSRLCEGTGLKVMFPITASGPFASAIRLRGFNNLLMDLYDDPQYVNDLMDTITGYIKEFSQARAKYLGEPMAQGLLHNDEIAVPIISPQTYEEVILPRECELANFWGGVRYWHSCGETTPLFESIAKIPGLKMMHVGPWSDPGHAAEVFGPKDICLNICVNSVRDMYEKSFEEMRAQLLDIRNACDGKVRYEVRCDGIAVLNSEEEMMRKIGEWSRAAREVFPG